MDVRLESLFPSPVLHPGAVLKAEFLDRYEISQGELAKAIGIEPTNLCAAIHRRRAVRLDLGRLLAMALATSPEFWLLRQLAWDLEHARPLPVILPMPQMADAPHSEWRLRAGLFVRKCELESERWPLREASG